MNKSENFHWLGRVSKKTIIHTAGSGNKYYDDIDEFNLKTLVEAEDIITMEEVNMELLKAAFPITIEDDSSFF